MLLIDQRFCILLPYRTARATVSLPSSSEARVGKRPCDRQETARGHDPKPTRGSRDPADIAQRIPLAQAWRTVEQALQARINQARTTPSKMTCS